MAKPDDSGLFAELLPEGATLRIRKELPMVKCVIGKTEVSFTDLRILNEKASDVFKTCLYKIASNDGMSYADIELENMNDEEIDIISYIVSGISFSVNKKGKNGYRIWRKMIIGTDPLADRNGNKVIRFLFNGDDAKTIHDFVTDKISKDENIDLFKLAIAIAESCVKYV